MNNNKSNGELVELEFLYEAHKRGLVVSHPWGDNRKYDCIVDNGSDLLKTQIKSSTNGESGGYKVNTCYGNNTKNSRKKLYGNAVDVFVIKLPTCYFMIPSVEINTLTINLYPDDATHKYSKYKNNWDLLLTGGEKTPMMKK